MISSDGLNLLLKIKGDSSDATKAIKDVRDEAQKNVAAIEKENQTLGNSFSAVTPRIDAVSVAIGSLAAQAASQLAASFLQAGKAVLDYSSKLEQTEIGFASLLGNGEKAKKLLQEIQTFAKDTPFEFQGIAALSQRLLGANIEAEKIIPLMRDIGNVVAATGETSQERLSGITVALTQIISKQKLSAEEAEQFAERGVNAYDLIAKATGKTQTEIRKMGEEGKLSADLLVASLQKISQEKYGDAMAAQSKTFAGATSNIKDSLLIVASEAFKPLYEKISGLAARFAAEIQKQGNDFQGVGNVIAKYIGVGLEFGLETVLKGLGGYLGRRIGDIFTGKAFVDPLFKALVSGFYEAFEKAYVEFGNYGREKLGLANFNGQKINIQSGNYLNSADLETRMPGYTADSVQSPIKVLETQTKKTAKTVGDSFDKTFRAFAEDIDFRVTRVKGGAVNSGSKHPAGLAGDLSIKGKSIEEIVFALGEGIKKGFKAIDERFVGAIRGVKSTGPNAHFESSGSKKSSLFVENRPDLYGGQAGLDYLKKLDAERLAGKTSADEIKKFAEDRVKEQEKANEQILKDRETADRRVLERAKQTANESAAINDQLLARNQISQDEYNKRTEQSDIDLLNKEKMLLEERLALAVQLGVDIIEIEEAIASVASEIKTKQTASDTAAYLQSRKYAEELKALRLEVLETERELIDFRKEQERKVLSNDVENRRGRARLDALVVLREFDIEELRRNEERRQADLEAEKNASIARLSIAELELGKREELEELYYNRALFSKEEFEVRKKEIEDSYKAPTAEAEADGVGGFLGGLIGGLGTSVEQMMEKVEPLKGIGDIIGSQFQTIAQGVGAAVKSFVLFGTAGGSFKKFAAEMIASIAQMSAVQAIFEAAQAVAMAALFAFTGNPAYALSATQHSTAAVIYGLVAGVAAVTGRAVAGNSFSGSRQANDANTGGAYGASAGGGAGASNTSQERNTAGGAYSGYGDDTRLMEGSINRPTEIVRHEIDLSDSNGNRREFVLNVIRDDANRNGDMRQLLKSIAEGV